MQETVSFQSELARYGIGLFETIRVEKGEPLFLPDHLDRLYSSLSELEIPFPLPAEELAGKIRTVLQQAPAGSAALRLTVHAGGYHLATRPFPYRPEDYKRGFRLTVSPVVRGKSPLYKHKTTSYFENIYSRRLAQKEGYDEALFLNMTGSILEGSASNIFFLQDDTLYTPPAGLGLLPGIARKKVLAIAGRRGLNTVCREIRLEETPAFAGAFVTNSLLHLMKVREIAGVAVYQEENSLFAVLEKEFAALAVV